MKKIINIIWIIGIIMLNIANIQAQTIISENFDATTTGSTSCGAVCPAPTGWTQVTTQSKYWSAHAGSTPSSNTGPTGDHTSGSGKYMYLEASSGCTYKTGNLISPSINLSSYSTTTLKLWYHMYGSEMGSFHIDISTNGGTSWTNDIWSKTGDQGNSWKEASVDLSSYSGGSNTNVKIRLRGITGSSYHSDICFDDFSIIVGTGGSSSSGSSILSQDFESTTSTNSQCNTVCPAPTGWTQSTTQSKYWCAHTGYTASSNTGPSGDHTSGSGNYMYLEASGCYSKTANLISPSIDLSSYSSVTLSFWYHMFGAAMGSLQIDISTNGGANWTTAIWSKSGNQGSSWNEATVNLSSYAGGSYNNVKIRFSGTTGTQYTSDICIDDISVTSGTGSGTGTATAVTIGTGTSNIAMPVYEPYAYSYSQVIYTSSQIGGAMTINKIAYHFQGTGWSSADPIKIYMGTTSKSSFSSSSDWVSFSSLTLVYDGGLSASPGWVELTLSTPYVYSGSGNLVIAVDENSSTTRSSAFFSCTATSNNMGLLCISNNTNINPASPSGSNYLRNGFANVKLSSSVQSTRDIGVSQITSPSSQLKVNQSTAVKVKVKNYGTSAITSGTINWKLDSVTKTPYNFALNIDTGAISSEITIGNISVSSGNHSITAWTSNPNGTSDIDNTNDSATTNFNTELFSESSSTFKNYSNGSIDWGDYDNDGDLDFVLTGYSGSYNTAAPFTKIYKNNGNGTFSIQDSISLTGVYYSNSEWGDYNNDGYLDLLISGKDSSFNSVSIIYKNNGNNTFTSQSGIDNYSHIAYWIDYDNDGDLDVLGNSTESINYKNENGSFVKNTSIDLSNIESGGIKWVDINNDGNMDIFLQGRQNSYQYFSKVYINNGDYSFTEKTQNSIVGLRYSHVQFGDYDNDGDLDLFINGEKTYSGTKVSKLYKNTGSGSFTEQSSISFIGVSNGNMAWGDYDSDGDLDIIISGIDNSNSVITKLYTNNYPSNSFSANNNVTFPAINNSDIAWGDYDNDGDLDVFLTGSTSIYQYNSYIISKLFTNNNNTSYTPSIPTGLTAQTIGSKIKLAWNKSTDPKTQSSGLSYNIRIGSSSAAINIKSPQSNLNNGYHRVAEIGAIKDTFYMFSPNINLPACSTIYWSVQAINPAFNPSAFSTTNNVGNVLTKEISSDTTIYYGGTAQLNAKTNSCASASYLWSPSNTLNNPNVANPIASPLVSTRYFVSITTGNSTLIDSVDISVNMFKEQSSISIKGVYNSSTEWGDYDNDGDLDLLVLGDTNYNKPITKLYSNNGNNNFSEVTSVSFPQIKGSAAWGDYDNDGDLDILLIGQDAAYNRISKIYKNNGNNTFTEQTNISLTGVSYSSVAWGDYNNDGYLDILLTGQDAAYNKISKIYKNTGNNSFKEQTSIHLDGIYNGSATWADYNNDGYLDILIVGATNNYSSGNISRLYKNNGNNTFSLQTSTIPAIIYGNVDWGDYDNDGKLDILISGSNSNSHKITEVYRNTGNNSFTKQTSISLASIYQGNAIWGDYDNDGDLDILLSGKLFVSNNTYIPTTKIYKNNGLSGFNEVTDISLTGLKYGTADWVDYDNDSDLDIFITGYDNDNNGHSKIYKNTHSNNNPTPPTPSGLSAQSANGSIILSWDKVQKTNLPNEAISYNISMGTINDKISISSPQSNLNSGFHRIVHSGMQQDTFCIIKPSDLSISSCTKLYWSVQSIDKSFNTSAFATFDSINNVLSILTNNDTTIVHRDTAYLNVENNACGQVSYSWSPANSLNNANIKTPIATPVSNTTYKVTVTEGQKSYIDSIKVNVEFFEEQSNITLYNTTDGSSEWGDFDNDNDLDLLLSGNGYSKVFRNNGDNTFSYLPSIALEGVIGSDATWGDYNNDGYLDILLTGKNSSYQNVSKIYKNNGDNTYTEQTSISLTGVSNGSIAYGDYDSDGDLDILLTGKNSSNTPISVIYRNDSYSANTGIYTFSEQTSISLNGVYDGSVAWGDYNNDGYIDIILSGKNISNQGITKIYKNNGNNSFSEQTAISLPGVYSSSVAFGDYDNDGDLDILLTGNSSSGPISRIYKNNGASSNPEYSFTEQSTIILTGVYNSSVAMGDCDNDGNLDILYTGYTGSEKVTKVYINNGNGGFEEKSQTALRQMQGGSISLADYDNDGDLDILLTSDSTKLYRNKIHVYNNIPTTPTNTSTYIKNDSLWFIWNKSSDDFTSKNSLSYNIALGRYNNINSKYSSHSSAISGRRRIVKIGNNQFDTCFRICTDSFYAGTPYIWQVQAIDNAYKGSQFSNLDTAFIPLHITIERTDTVSICPQSFALNVKDNANTNTSTLSYQWSPSTGLSNTNIKNPIASHIGTTTYYVTVTSTDGYIATDSFTVTLYPIPSSDFSIATRANTNSDVVVNYSGQATTNAAYIWDFDWPSANSGSGQGPFHISWDTTGTKYPSLLVSENGCTSAISIDSIDIVPTATFSIQDSVCKHAISSITYTGSASTTATYSWDFDNAIIVSGSGQGPYEVKWTTDGIKTISLSVKENGVTSYIFTDSVYVKPIYESNFSSSTSILVTDTANFTYSGLAPSTAIYNWSFDGGNITSGSGQGPLNINWTNSGIKQIELYITGANGCNSLVTTSQINVKPTADFITDSIGCLNSNVQITYTGTAAYNASFSWNWDGGTVISGSGIGPYQVRWNTIGTKDISLTVVENAVSSSNTKKTDIYALPTSNFVISDSVCANSTTTVLYQGAISSNASYSWNFGNAVLLSGTDAGPYVLKWTSSGNQSVSLSTFDFGCTSALTTKTITVKPQPISAFSMAATASIEDTVALQYSGSTNSVNNFNWDLSGGSVLNSTSQGLYNVKWLTGGIKTVSLSVTGTNSCVSSSTSSNIQISPSSDFNMTSSSNVGTSVSITYSGSASASAMYYWNFNGGTITSGSGQGPYQVFWPSAGPKTVSLTVFENGVSSTISSKQITISPSSNFAISSNICQNDTSLISFQGTAGYNANYVWNWDGGTVVSGSGQGPYQLLWNTSGSKTVSLTVTENGQSSTYSKAVSIIALPNSSFSISDSACNNVSIPITYTGNASSTATYNWNFDGGTIVNGSGQGPYQVYWSSPGNHNVSLLVNANNCSSLPSTSVIKTLTLPSSNFTIPTLGSSDDTIMIEYSGDTSSILAYNWNFDGGSIVNGNYNNYNIRWISSGSKNVSLYVVGTNSCISQSTVNSIQIAPSSLFIAPSLVNVNENANINYTGTASSTAIYTWNFDGGTIVSGSGQGPYTVKWTTSGIKNVSLSVTENGITSNISTNQIIAKPTSYFSSLNPICQNDTTTISYQGSASSNAIYTWDFDGGIISSGNAQGPYNVYWYTPGTKNIQLSVTENGITSDLNIDSIIINPSPIASFTFSSNSLSTGDTCIISYTGSSASSAIYNWSFENANTTLGSGQGPYTVSWDTSGVKQVQLMVMENGCSSQLIKSNVIITPSSYFYIDSLACKNETVTVNYTGQASTSASYNWNFDNGQIISGFGQGPYQVKWDSSGNKTISLVVYENGLSSVQTNKIINIKPLPLLSISQNQAICLHNSVTLSSNVLSGIAPISYLWSSSDTTPTTTVSPINDSLFTLTITDANNCQNSDSTFVIVTQPYSNEEICLVTVDSATQKNIIVWEKTPNNGTNYYKIYRESYIVNVYDSIGFVPYDSLGYFLDPYSFPKVRPEKYKISTVDSCGNESLLSPHHKTMHLTINKGIGWTFNLIWTPYEGFQVQTYKIWRWTATNGWLEIDSVSGGVTTYTDHPTTNTVYYVVEIVPPHPCNITKANTNYNISRSNTANTTLFIGTDIGSTPSNNSLEINIYPNPFTDNSSISYDLQSHSNVKIEIYTSLGELVSVIADEHQDIGIHKYRFNSIDNGLSNGVYLLRMTVDDKVFTKKLVEVK